MAKTGDVITTSSGEVYRMVGNSDDTSKPADISTVASLLRQTNINLNILVDTFRWSGKYDSIEEQYEPGTERKEIVFKYPVRFLRVIANQPIKIQLNDKGNPSINVDISEMPFTLSGVTPGFYIDKIYITPSQLATNLKILAMG